MPPSGMRAYMQAKHCIYNKQIFFKKAPNSMVKNENPWQHPVLFYYGIAGGHDPKTNKQCIVLLSFYTFIYFGECVCVHVSQCKLENNL